MRTQSSFFPQLRFCARPDVRFLRAENEVCDEECDGGEEPRNNDGASVERDIGFHARSRYLQDARIGCAHGVAETRKLFER